MRAFIALDIPDEFADDVAALSRQLGAYVDGRFMSRDSYHITLAFLGEISDAEISASMEAIDAACNSVCADGNKSDIILKSDGLGKFGSKSKVTLWMGVAPVPALLSLDDELRLELDKHKVPYESKPFKPHITLARSAHIGSKSFSALAFPEEAQARSVTLYKSTLTQDGAVYKALYTAKLSLQKNQRAAGYPTTLFCPCLT